MIVTIPVDLHDRLTDELINSGEQDITWGLFGYTGNQFGVICSVRCDAAQPPICQPAIDMERLKNAQDKIQSAHDKKGYSNRAYSLIGLLHANGYQSASHYLNMIFLNDIGTDMGVFGRMDYKGSVAKTDWYTMRECKGVYIAAHVNNSPSDCWREWQDIVDKETQLCSQPTS